MPVGQPDEFEDMMIFSLTDLDNDNNNDYQMGGPGVLLDEEDPMENKRFKPAMSLKQRRRSRLGAGIGGGLSKLLVDLHEHPEEDETNTNKNISQERQPRSARENWKIAFQKIREMTDPWATLHIDSLEAEKATRHRYNALKRAWTTDEVEVKMEKEPFNHGAMRECYRLKKRSRFLNKQEWKHAQNYVAKLYMENVEREVYFEDVRLQMDAKLWGEEYNRHHPPKQVDIFQMYILEMKDRPGKPLYHLEHFIEGDYQKYNSNSGFVDENLRLTPQAFSHFTFERSGHQLIVVDIQGVGDLWTDPQIHTTEGTGYGDGNLGARGMALFFHSHVCNRICESFNLSKFDLAPSEQVKQSNFRKMMATRRGTVVKGTELMCLSASPREQSDLAAFLERSRLRNMSTCSSAISEEPSDYDEDENVPRRSSLEEEDEEDYSDSDSGREEIPMSPGSPFCIPHRRIPRTRYASESEESTSISAEEERIRFQQLATRGARPSCIAHEINLRKLSNNLQLEKDSVLGQIHHELAKYHEIGRFVQNESEIDMDAALFHENHAAELGVKEAILAMAYLHLGMQHDVLVNLTVSETPENINTGVNFMEMAAEYGDRSAMIFMARAYETGLNLGNEKSVSYQKAVDWLEKAVTFMQKDESGEFDATMDNPMYQLQARIAELYLSGGPGLEKDPSYSGEMYNEAAESAMASMKGRLATKYYALAEEAYAQVEEEE